MREAFPAPGLVEPSEVLNTHTESADWHRAMRETADYPQLGVEHLTDEEKAKIRLHYVPATHIPENDTAIAATMGVVNYYLSESVFKPETEAYIGNRRSFDIAINMWSAGHSVSTHASGIEHFPDRHYISRDPCFEQLVKQSHQAGKPTPVFRSYDIDSTTPVPIDADTPHTTISAIIAEADKLSLYSQGGGFYEKTNAELIADQERSVMLRNLSNRYREAKQVQDISTIVANAVRRHPEMEEIHFGITMGATHMAGHRPFLEATQLSADITYLRDSGAGASFYSARLLEQAMPTTEELKKLLVCSYATHAIVVKSGRIYSRDAMLKLDTHITSLPADIITETLNQIDRLKEVAKATAKANVLEEYGSMDDEPLISAVAFLNASSAIGAYLKTLPGVPELTSQIG